MTSQPTAASRKESRSGDENLAKDIARAFKDESHLSMYRFFLDKFGEEVIRRAFDEAQAVPARKIKRSRPALFIYLVRKYGRKEK